MPRKRTNAKPRKFKRRRYRRRRNPGFTTVNRPFPLIRFAKLRIFDEILINPTGSIGYTSYGANCLYDTFLGTGGHQPMGFDQLMALYNHYEVYGAKVTVRFLPNGEQYYCGVAIDDDTTFTGTPTTGMEQRGSSMKYMAVTAIKPVIITKHYSQKKMFGMTARGTDNQKGTASANPSERGVFQIWTSGVAGADPGALTVLVEVEYFAKFSELKTLPAS